MHTILRRLSSLVYLARPLALTFLGIMLLSVGCAYLFIWIYRNAEVPAFFSILTLQFLPHSIRGLLFLVFGLGSLGAGIWQLSTMVIIPLNDREDATSELVLGYKRNKPPKVAVLSGGAGMLILADLGERVDRLTCITPVHEPVEYYYRASGLFAFHNVYYVVPTPVAAKVYAELDNGATANVMHIDHNLSLAERHVKHLRLVTDDEKTQPYHAPNANGHEKRDVLVQPAATASLPLTRVAHEALRDADAIVLGPGSLFESILPNLLIDQVRETIQQSDATTIYICNLMTEPGLTTSFDVADHIRQIKRYGGFTPDYVLVNAQRIETEIHQLYAAAHQAPVYLDPDAYEETTVVAGARSSQRHILVEGSVVIEADLSSSVVQYTASLDNPGTSRAVRVLRHDTQKLTAAILRLLKL